MMTIQIQRDENGNIRAYNYNGNDKTRNLNMQDRCTNNKSIEKQLIKNDQLGKIEFDLIAVGITAMVVMN